MSRPYTQRFIVWDGAGGVRSSYVVPAGYRVIVRSVLAWGDAVGAGFNLELGAATVYLWSAPGAFAGVAAAVHVAAYAGETLSILRSGTRTGGVVSGYIFQEVGGPIGRQITRGAQEPRRGLLPSAEDLECSPDHL